MGYRNVDGFDWNAANVRKSEDKYGVTQVEEFADLAVCPTPLLDCCIAPYWCGVFPGLQEPSSQPTHSLSQI